MSVDSRNGMKFTTKGRGNEDAGAGEDEGEDEEEDQEDQEDQEDEEGTPAIVHARLVACAGLPGWLQQLGEGRYGIAYDFRTHSLVDHPPDGWYFGDTRNWYSAVIHVLRAGGLWKAQYSMYMGYAHPTWFYMLIRRLLSATALALKESIPTVPTSSTPSQRPIEQLTPKPSVPATMAQPQRVRSKNAQMYFTEEAAAARRSEQKTDPSNAIKKEKIPGTKPNTVSVQLTKGEVIRREDGSEIIVFEILEDDDVVQTVGRSAATRKGRGSAATPSSKPKGNSGVPTLQDLQRSAKCRPIASTPPRNAIPCNKGAPSDTYKDSEDSDDELEDEEDEAVNTSDSRRPRPGRKQDHTGMVKQEKDAMSKNQKRKHVSDDDGDTDLNTKAKLTDFSDGLKLIIQETKEIFRIQCYTINLYPNSHKVNEYLETAVDIANSNAAKRDEELCRAHQWPTNVRLDLKATPTAKSLIMSTGTWSRSRLKTTTQAVMPDVPDELRKRAVAVLLERFTFIFADIRLAGDKVANRRGPFRHPALKMLFNEAFLGTPGPVKGAAWDYPKLFKEDMWPLGLVAVLTVTLHFAL
ncbi:hypothetical protein CALVIDRAFT_568327 [Calocera viscosa TUFC12733]|uniref:DUF6532 domain-containing protein n=1 Tax=Calocera viscosa (strain TUFC12733) TaxID=1330018 RepID=A0A167H6G4_CALVF|nr:hypothetical protein CALVIDRAFT_568327 [Calocera viscosa TUFC12733]